MLERLIESAQQRVLVDFCQVRDVVVREALLLIRVEVEFKQYLAIKLQLRP